MPVELRMWLLLALGCMGVSMGISGVCMLVPNGVVTEDRIGIFYSGAFLGILLGTLAPTILVLGRSGVVNKPQQVVVPLVSYAVCAVLLCLVVKLWASLAVLPIFAALRVARIINEDRDRQ